MKPPDLRWGRAGTGQVPVGGGTLGGDGSGEQAGPASSGLSYLRGAPCS